jgi:hypothetical protein
LEEPDLVFWVAIDRAGEDDEELQHDAAGEEEDGDEGEDRSCICGLDVSYGDRGSSFRTTLTHGHCFV